MLTTWAKSGQTEIEWIEAKWPGNSARGLFSLRRGGVSQDPYSSLNVGLAVGDSEKNVLENRRRVADVLGGDLSEWVLGQQVHGANVHVVTEADKGGGGTCLTSAIPGTDGLITCYRHITLAVLAADCVPVLFYDPVGKTIGAAHSGWKGTTAHISREVVRQMSLNYGTQPQDLYVWLGPSIRRCCYEVDEKVAGPVRREFGGRFLLPRKNSPGKYLLGLQQCIRHDLLLAGIPASQIQDTGLCTASRVPDLYSHRKEAGKTGRSLGAVRLT